MTKEVIIRLSAQDLINAIPDGQSMVERHQLEERHGKMVHRLEKPADDIRATMTHKRTTQLLAAIRLFVEAGEQLDLAKKQFFYNKEQEALQKDAGFLAACETVDDLYLVDRTDRTLNRLHHVVGIAGEASELLDGVTKSLIHVSDCSKTLGKYDRVNEVEELGDLEFYLRGFRDASFITKEEVLEQNIAKLDKRYGSGSYSDTQAIARADKVDTIESLTDVAISDIVGDGKLTTEAENKLKVGEALFGLKTCKAAAHWTRDL